MALAMVVLLANGTPHWVSSIVSLVLLQAWLTEPYRIGGNTPSWSLSCEAFFYACFPVLMRRLATASVKGCYRIVLVAFVAMVLWNGAYAGLTLIDMPAVTALSTYTNPAYRIGEFIIGMAVGIAIRQGWRSHVSLPTALIFGTIGYIGLALINHLVVSLGVRLGGPSGIPLGLQDLAYLPVTVLLVAAAATSDIEGRWSPIAGKWHIRLGEWSFALYLIQAVVIGLVAEAVNPSWPLWASTLTLIGTVAVCIALSAALFNWVEKPAEAFIRRRFTVSRPALLKVEAGN
jgi:peptidoglycan/LPS O-acetylase OafA/YrhL